MDILSDINLKEMYSYHLAKGGKAYLDLAKRNDIYTYHHGHNYWFDVGSVGKLSHAEKIISNNPGIFVQ